VRTFGQTEIARVDQGCFFSLISSESIFHALSSSNAKTTHPKILVNRSQKWLYRVYIFSIDERPIDFVGGSKT